MTILGILLTILRTLGIILLIVFLLLLLILLLVLFVPIRYRIHVDKEGWDMNAGASVTWLLRMLAVDVAYSIRDSGERGLVKDIRIFGISIFKVKDWLSKRKRKKPRKEPPEDAGTESPEAASEAAGDAAPPPDSGTEQSKDAPAGESPEEAEGPPDDAGEKKEDAPPEPEESRAGEETRTAEDTEAAVISADEKPRRSLPDRLLDKIFGILRKAAGLLLAFPGGIVNLALTLLMKGLRWLVRLCSLPGLIVSLLGSFIDKVLTIRSKIILISDFFFDDRTQDAIHLVFSQIGHLIGHIRPRTLSGYLDFGFDDPSVTGRVLGGLSLFLPQCGKTFDINPDFEKPLFNCDINSSGRIYLFYIVYILIRTILDKNIRYVYRYTKHIRKELSRADAA